MIEMSRIAGTLRRQILLVTALATGCSSVDIIAARQIPAEARPDAAAVARANNQFACDLYAQLAASDGNLFLSPFSITTALAMTDAGAAGITDEELRTALHMTELGDRVHTAYRALLDSLAIGRDHGAYTLATANRLFGQYGLSFQPRFLDITRRDYGAELMRVDFEGDLEGARKSINTWVSDQTDDKIPELFPEGGLDSDALLVLANAILFKGTWENKFDPQRTIDAPFTLPDGRTVQSRQMRKTREEIALGGIPGGTIGVLPFDGKDLSMIVVLPTRPDGLPAIEAQLSADVIAQWLDGLEPEKIDVGLPRFRFKSAIDLADVLEELGIVSAFDPQLADLSGITDQRDLFLAQVRHVATIAVDEAGAEAAAATGAVAIPTSLPPELVVDRPFLFWIYDHVTGAILFMGRIQDPTVTGE
jgi:serpin B